MTRSAAILLPILAALAGCASYEPAPIDPARTEAAQRARALASPGLRAFVDRHAVTRTAEWPPRAWDLERLTLAAIYWHPDLDVARARLRVAEAGLVTAGTRPNPNLSFAPQYVSSTEPGFTPWTLGFTLDVPIETAGKRGKRIERAEREAEAARLAVGE